MDDHSSTPSNFADEFDAGFAQLRAKIEASCAAVGPFAAKIAAAIAASLEFAATEPAIARTLAVDWVAHGAEGNAKHQQYTAEFADQLRGMRSGEEELPDFLEEMLVGAITGVIGARVRAGTTERLTGLAPQLAELTLLPYLGRAEARRWAQTVAPADPDGG